MTSPHSELNLDLEVESEGEEEEEVDEDEEVRDCVYVCVRMVQPRAHLTNN